MVQAPSVFSLIAQSDGITLGVLGLLLISSTVCWATYIYQVLLLRSCRLDARRLLKYVVTSKDMIQLEQYTDRDMTTPLFQNMYRHLVHILRTWQDRIQINGARDSDWMYLESSLSTVHEEIRRKLSSGFSILMVGAESAPLLGLFGTVWGLIHSFMRIAQMQSADIATVAPGIAEALITTLAGLLVALPALAMYHMLTARYQAVMSLVSRQLDGVMRLAATAPEVPVVPTVPVQPSVSASSAS